MAYWKDRASRAISGAGKLAADIERKNRRAARKNRLRTVIRCQKQAADKEYMALGRYYYNALRDKGNPLAEEHCMKLDKIQALLDSTLESLEQTVREEASSIGIIGSADGPVAVYVPDKKDGTLFHFGGGPFEITVTRDTAAYRPEDEDSEEIDLSDVKSFDHDPMPEYAPPNDKQSGLSTPAELDENDGLPFEG